MAARMADYQRNRNCALCSNTFKEPKFLDCFHSFCKNCLEDYVMKESEAEELNCPTCKKVIKIPETGVQGLTSNFYLENIEEGEKADNIGDCERRAENIEDHKGRGECDVCDNGLEPEYSCNDCQQLMCAACKKFHDSLTSCRRHEVNALNEDGLGLYNTVVCPHHNKSCAEFCLDCQLVICGRCTKRKHGAHTIMNLDEVGDVAEKARTELKGIQEKLEESLAGLRDVKTAVQRESFKLNAQADEACKQVDIQIEEIFANLKKEGERIKLEIRNASSTENLLLNHVNDDVTDQIHKLDSSNELLTNHIKVGDELEVLTVLPRFKYKQGIIASKRYIIPNLKFPRFEKAPVEASPKIGKVAQ